MTITPEDALKLADEAAVIHDKPYTHGAIVNRLIKRLEQAVRGLVEQSEHRYVWAMAQQKLADEARAELAEARIALAHKEGLADSWREKCLDERTEVVRLQKAVEESDRKLRNVVKFYCAHCNDVGCERCT